MPIIASPTSLVTPIILSEVDLINSFEFSNTFFGCSSLVNAPSVIPSGITSLYDTFRGCESIVTVPNIPSGITDMTYAFAFCSSLKELTLLPTTPPIYSSTLNGCSSLETIYVPDLAIYDYRNATGWSQFESKFKQLSEKPSE